MSLHILLAIALEQGNKNIAENLALRLQWPSGEVVLQDMNQILEINNLPHSLLFNLAKMQANDWVFSQRMNAVIQRQDQEKWLVYTENTTITYKNYIQLFNDASPVVLLPTIPKWLMQLYNCKADAMCIRRSDQLVYAIDWAKKKKDEDTKTKRFFCSSNTEMQNILNNMMQRPLCDQTLYTIALDGYVVPNLVLDIEAHLKRNPQLKSREAQKQYVETVLSLLEQFLGPNNTIESHFFALGSDAKKFSSRLYVRMRVPFRNYEHHDETVVRFFAWLMKCPDANVLRIIHKYKDSSTGAKFKAITLAIDCLATGRHRQMRCIGFSKAGQRKFVIENGMTLLEAVIYANPNLLNQPSKDKEEEDEQVVYQALVERIDEMGETTSPYLIKDTSGRAPPEATFLYNFPRLYHFLKVYEIPANATDEQKQQETHIWSQPWSDKNRVTRFAVPMQAGRELLHLQAESEKPTLLHECHDQSPKRVRKAHVDMDRTTLHPQLVAKEWSQFLARSCNLSKPIIAIKLAPPKEVGFFWYHLIAPGVLVSGQRDMEALRHSFALHLYDTYGKEKVGSVDIDQKNLRMEHSDKGNFDGRTLICSFYYDPASDQFVEELDPHIRQYMCTTHVCPNSTPACTILNDIKETYEKIKGSNKTIHGKGKPYDPNNEQHRALAKQVEHVFKQAGRPLHEAVILSIEFESPHWLIYINFCPILKRLIDEGKKSMSSRKSPYQHASHVSVFKVLEDRIILYCNDSECAKARHDLFGGCVQVSLFRELMEPLYDLEVPVNPTFQPILPITTWLRYIAQQECPEDCERVSSTNNNVYTFPNGKRICYIPELQAYQRLPSKELVRIPKEHCTNERSARALLFHQSFPENQYVVGFDCNFQKRVTAEFVLRNGAKIAVTDKALLHKAYHEYRAQTIFGRALIRRNVGQSKRLWDYPLSSEKKETWYTRSGKGSGKSYQAKRVVGNSDGTFQAPCVLADSSLSWDPIDYKKPGSRPANILIASPQISVAHFFKKEYGGASYLDPQFSSNMELFANQSKIIISLESIHRLPIWYTADIVLLDESEGLLQLFSGKTMRTYSRQGSWDRFSEIVSYAKLVVASDARLGEKTHSILHTLRPNAKEQLFYNYQAENGNRYIQYRDESAWYDELNKAIHSQKPIYLVVNSKEQAIQLQQHIQGKDPDGKILLATGETYNSQEEVKRAVDNCKIEWIKYRYVIVSPVVGPALDFTIEPTELNNCLDYHFHYCFAWATPRSNTPAQFFQMIGRVRKIESQEVHYFVNHGPTTEPVLSPERMRSRILQSAKQTTLLGIRLHGGSHWNVLDQSFECKPSDSLFLDLYVANLHETQSGIHDFAGDFALLIEEQQGVPPTLQTAKGPIDVLLELILARSIRKEEKDAEEWDSFSTAPDITQSTAQTISKRLDQNNNDVTKQEINSLERFNFRSTYGMTMDEEITRDAFEHDNPKKRVRIRAHEDALLKPLKNVLLREGIEDHRRLNQLHHKDCTIADVQLKALPRDMQLRVFRAFGFCDSLDVAQCLHNSVHIITGDYCEKTAVMAQIPLLSIYTLVGQESVLEQVPRKENEAYGKWAIRWFRSFLFHNWEARLIKRKKGYIIEAKRILDIIKKRKVDIQVEPPSMDRLVHKNVPISSFSIDTLIAFVIQFTPRLLPALAASSHLVSKPVSQRKEFVSDFHQGLLHVDHYLLYSDNHQHWLLSYNNQELSRIQLRSVQEVIALANINPLRQGSLFDTLKKAIFFKVAEWVTVFASIHKEE
jgi:hypothetical protein